MKTEDKKPEEEKPKKRRKKRRPLPLTIEDQDPRNLTTR